MLFVEESESKIKRRHRAQPTVARISHDLQKRADIRRMESHAQMRPSALAAAVKWVAAADTH
jgi:hypothetical protein